LNLRFDKSAGLWARIHRRALVAACLCLLPIVAHAQQTTEPTDATDSQTHTDPADVVDDPLTTMFHHAEWDKWWVSGQANFISQ
jgi:hypothetical protein